MNYNSFIAFNNQMKFCRKKRLLKKTIEHTENFGSQTPFKDFLICILFTDGNEIHQPFRRECVLDHHSY